MEWKRQPLAVLEIARPLQIAGLKRPIIYQLVSNDPLQRANEGIAPAIDEFLLCG
jgi:hypothetical protein